ncbi:MAG: V-type ATP synthase subunit D [Candidatus Rehaiarchaeum fermentans]|nr:V-type ATP synthase subunit D [Candidatus Rehaiarchaeum fermentans]
MESGTKSRGALIKEKEDLKFIKDSAELLKSSRSRLIKKFIELLQESKNIKEYNTNLIEEAKDALVLAIALNGKVAFNRYSVEIQHANFQVEKDSVLGIPLFNVIPQINQILDQNLPNEVKLAYEKFYKLAQEIIELAQREINLKKLLLEIFDINRKINAIERVIIPERQRKIKEIIETLDNLELEEKSRLIKYKYG